MVLMPAVEKLSLSEYGTPARGPLTFPDAISRAESKSGVMNALLPFVDFQLASQAATLRTACPRSDLIMMMEVNLMTSRFQTLDRAQRQDPLHCSKTNRPR